MLAFLFLCTIQLPAQSGVAPSGTGTAGDPYLIATWQNLYWVSQNQLSWSKYFLQTADIDFADASPAITSWDGGKGWQPLGPSSPYFTGVYDGGHHTISGLYINRTTGRNALFAIISGVSCTVKNLGVINANITGAGDNCGIAGNNSALISECYVTGTINSSGTATRTAGLVGTNNGTITKSYSQATINGYQQTAGLVGFNAAGSSVTNSYAVCNITTTNSYAGGLAGQNSGSLTNVYARGTLTNTTGAGYIGGVAGTNDGTIQNAYSTVTVSVSSYTNVFGFTGRSTSGTETGCLWDIDLDGISGNSIYNFDALGKSTAEMKTNATFFDAGWDMNIWYRDDNFNDGYPYLAWQNSGGTPLPVELISFTARADGRTVTLQWKTATEVNNYGFDIERFGPFERPVDVETMHPDRIGTSASSLRVIGFVPGHGNSNSEKSYIYTDNSPADGYYYYRLKQIDTDGQFEHSGIVEVSVLTIPQELTLYQNYPNPFNAGTIISFALPHHLAGERVTLSVYDVTGSLTDRLYDRAAEPGRHDIYWNGAERASGIYIIRLQGGGEMRVLRVILLK